jgi:hypothetical protein
MNSQGGNVGFMGKNITSIPKHNEVPHQTLYT